MFFHRRRAEYRKLVEREGELWGRSKTGVRISWFDSPLIYRYICQSVSGRPHVDWVDYIKEKYFHRPAELGLTAGCGHGDAERHFLQRDVVRRMEAFDISPQAIEQARRLAEERGFGERARYFVGDANYLEDAPLSNSYDVIFGVMSLHHFEQLEKCLDELQAKLKPGGYFIADEFIGPERFQWSDAQLEAANRLLACFPKELRRYLDRPDEWKTLVKRPTIEEMMKYQAFEAICSPRIISAIQKRFDVLEIKYYGGTVLHILFEGIMGNFKEENEREHAIMVRMAIECERLLLAHGGLPHDHALIVARKK
ncbi:MAG: class I SAM-dependent methyltransferase [Candidatus Omnitrophota bacterium]